MPAAAFQWGLEDADVREYCTFWAAGDLWAKGKDFSALVPGAVASSVDACPDEELEVNTLRSKGPARLRPRS